jgi:hypothetical protein
MNVFGKNIATALMLSTISTLQLAAAHGISENGVAAMSAPEDNKSAESIIPVTLAPPARDPARLVVNQLKVWDVAATIKICFLDGKPTARKHVAEVGSEWTKFANLKFDFGDLVSPRTCLGDGSENIKISFHAQNPYGGYWSYVGKDSNKYSPSMNLQDLDAEPSVLPEKEIDRIIWHEFGHAIGLEHEHQSPEAHCADEIDWVAANEYYHRCCSWTQTQVKDNLSTMVASTRFRVTPYDPKSIMHYALPASIFRDGRNSRCFTQTNYTLSVSDKEAIGITYPDLRESRDTRDKALLGQLDKILSEGGVDSAERAHIIDATKSTYQITTSGACSPVLTNVGGNVTLTLECK